MYQKAIDVEMVYVLIVFSNVGAAILRLCMFCTVKVNTKVKNRYFE